MWRGLAAFSIACVFAVAACGGNGDDKADDGRCMTVKEQFTDTTRELCCKQSGERATYRIACGRHVAIGCEGDLYCTVYTDDNEVTHECMSATTCGLCASVGDTGLQLWCHDHILYGD
jgi:hypothetical protein